MKNKKKVITTLAACGLLGALGIGGTMAYLTDADEQTNVFTVGQVDIELDTPNFENDESVEEGQYKISKVLPNQEVTMDPTITNNGVNDAIVFIKMDVPAPENRIFNHDGTVADAAFTDMFYFKDAGVAINVTANNFDSGWTLLNDLSDQTGETGEHTYVFGYNTKLAAKSGADGTATTPLFDKAQLKNIMDFNDQMLDDVNIELTAYAIQPEYILDGNSTTDLTTDLSEENLTKIAKLMFTEMQAENILDTGNEMVDTSANELP